VIKNGHYTFKIKDLHREYGPIVRINPEEIHIETPDFYEKVYAAGGKKRDKWDRFVRQFGLPLSIFGTIDHDKHRVRRAALNPFFSKAAVRRLQPVLDERLDKFLGRVVDFQESGKHMTISLGFAAFTAGDYS
jgi:cytochrome P450